MDQTYLTWKCIFHGISFIKSLKGVGNVELRNQLMWCNHCGEQHGKLKIELPYNPTIPLSGIYPDKTIIQKDDVCLSS